MSGPTLSMIDNKTSNVGIGNYKGVMLCNRPFGGSAAPRPEAKPDAKSFHAGVIPARPGENVSISSLEKNVIRPKKVTALSKHKKWLIDLQKTKDELEAKYIEDMNKKKEIQDKFTEREAKQRQVARALLHKENEDPTIDDGNILAEPKDITIPIHSTLDGKISPEKKATKKMNKPAWALTEETAAIISEEKEFEDSEGLLDFAANLNFEKYMDDLEIKTMMDKVKRRIVDLEREVVQEEQRIKESDDRAINRIAMDENVEEDDASDTREDAEHEEAMAAARALLEKTESMRTVHSTRSVAVMVKSAKDKEAKGETTIKNQPIIVTHDESEGSRLHHKDDVSKLPYIHRNPAV